MKSLKFFLIGILILNGGYTLYSWFSEDETTSSSNVEESIPQASEGLDLMALTQLTKEIRGGQELERRLNEPKGINNLDLNNDSKVDYIHVTEFGDQNQKVGYSLTTQPVKNETQEIASITIEKNADQAEIQVIGNEQIYGANAIYNDSAPIERTAQPNSSSSSNNNVVNHSYFGYSPWISPFSFGFYPPFYSPFFVLPLMSYGSQMLSYRGNSIQRGRNSYQSRSQRNIRNPNQGKTANQGIKRSLRKPTNTQRQFQARTRPTNRSGAFGRKTSRNSLNSGSSRSLGNNSNRLNQSRSFNNSNSFGRSRSFRSGSFGSRSFSFGGK